MLDHDLRGQMKRILRAPARRNSEQQVRKNKHKVVSAIVPYHTPGFSPETTRFPLKRALPQPLLSLSLSLCLENNQGGVNAAFYSHTPLR